MLCACVGYSLHNVRVRVCVCEMCTALVDLLVEINYASRIYRHDL